jgi:hypothetical protein
MGGSIGASSFLPAVMAFRPADIGCPQLPIKALYEPILRFEGWNLKDKKYKQDPSLGTAEPLHHFTDLAVAGKAGRAKRCDQGMDLLDI